MEKINNNKGFTLVELIVAMSIFTVVIGMGYRMLNKINISTKNQSEITSNQLNINLINKYVTKDLEQCKSFVGPDNTNIGSNYEFVINEGHSQVKYIVSITSKGSKEYYSLIRKSNDSEIDLITNEPKITEIPFFISKKENIDNLFLINMDNVNSTNSKYEFQVSSRLIVSSGEDIDKPENPNINPPIIDPDPTIPEDPKDDFKELFKTSFWVNNNAKMVNIGVLHPGEKQGQGVTEYKREQKVTPSINNTYKMSLYISLTNAGNHDYMTLENDKGNKVGNDTFQTQNLSEEANQIIVEVSPGTKFEIESNDTIKIPNVSIGNKTILESGKYRFKILPNYNGDRKHFKVSGTIIKGEGNASVYVYYGKSK